MQTISSETSLAAPVVEPRRPTTKGKVGLLLALAPWLWFQVRDIAAPFDGAAIMFPVVVAAGAVVAALAALIMWHRATALAVVSWLVVGALAIVGPWVPHR